MSFADFTLVTNRQGGKIIKRYFSYYGPTTSQYGAFYFPMIVNEFWEISVEGSTISTRFGKVGVTGQTAIKQFNSRGEAIAHAEKLINEKTKMGYVEK